MRLAVIVAICCLVGCASDPIETATVQGVVTASWYCGVYNPSGWTVSIGPRETETGPDGEYVLLGVPVGFNDLRVGSSHVESIQVTSPITLHDINVPSRVRFDTFTSEDYCNDTPPPGGG